MLPVLGRIGPFTFHTYAALVDLGLLAALLWLYFAEGGSVKRLDAGLLAIAGGLGGARLGYVIANLPYFGDHPGEALAIWTGGLSWPGAALGAAAGLWLGARWKGLPFLDPFAALALPAVLISALSWAGCWAAACAYGAEITSPDGLAWRLSVQGPDMFGTIAARWPVQPAGLLLSLITLAVLLFLRADRYPKGSLTSLALMMISAISLSISFFRADPSPMLNGLRLDTWASGAILVLSLVGLVVLYSRNMRITSENRR